MMNNKSVKDFVRDMIKGNNDTSTKGCEESVCKSCEKFAECGGSEAKEKRIKEQYDMFLIAMIGIKIQEGQKLTPSLVLESNELNDASIEYINKLLYNELPDTPSTTKELVARFQQVAIRLSIDTSKGVLAAHCNTPADLENVQAKLLDIASKEDIGIAVQEEDGYKVLLFTMLTMPIVVRDGYYGVAINDCSMSGEGANVFYGDTELSPFICMKVFDLQDNFFRTMDRILGSVKEGKLNVKDEA